MALLEKDGAGAWRPRPREALQRLLDIGYDDGIDADWRIDALASVARALNAGDQARAAMTLVHAGLPALDGPERARKMAEADALLKYSPDQPRVPAGERDGGQWSGGDTSATNKDRTRGLHTPSFRGDATYYKGRLTAYGKPFNANTLNAAMYKPNIIENGDVVKVQLNNPPYKSIYVTVNDTGPFERGDDGLALHPLRSDPRTVIDLTPRAFSDLTGDLSAGRVSVTVTKVKAGH